MNLLYLIPYTPTFIRTRPYYLLRAMARRGHALTLATVWEDEDELAELERWRQLGVKVVTQRLGKVQAFLNSALALPGRTPLQARYCWQPALAQEIGRMMKDEAFDAIHVEHLRGSAYALYVQALKPACPVIWDAVDCISLLFERAAGASQSFFGHWVTLLELPRTRRYEGWLVRQFPRVLVTAEGDRRGMEELSGIRDQGSDSNPQSDSNISVLPNGVDLEYFRPGLPGQGPRKRDTIVLTGKMSYHANVTAAVWLVNEVMPRVWARRPEVKVQIVGSAPGEAVRTLEKRNPGRVEVTGMVPDLRPYLQTATMAVAPIRYGVGIQNKVLEAMACGTPVVATAQAISAVQARSGEELLAADGAEDFAEAVLRMLGDEELRNRLGQAGRRYVEENHDWDKIAGQLEEIYKEEIDRFQR
jgi:sugar transferase (PEP-CTERM/EpsH1 system associated)